MKKLWYKLSLVGVVILFGTFTLNSLVNIKAEEGIDIAEEDINAEKERNEAKENAVRKARISEEEAKSEREDSLNSGDSLAEKERTEAKETAINKAKIAEEAVMKIEEEKSAE